MLALVLTGCDKSPLVAPTESTVTITAPSLVLPIGGNVQVTAFVVEQAGTPVQNGTTVRFSTNLGRIDPVEAQTRNGLAVTTFYAGDASGVAEIKATSGGITVTSDNALKIAVGGGAVDSVGIRVNPAFVSANGGTVEVTATVLGTGGRLLSGIPVTFSATAGTLSSTSAVSDTNGEARASVAIGSIPSGTTNFTVTASAGGKTSTQATVTIQPGPAVTLTCAVGTATTCATANINDLVVFTASRGTTSSNIVSATLEFGDGDKVDLGTLSGTVTASHRYTKDGTYTARLTARDVNGEVASATQVIRVEVLPTVSLSLSTTGCTVTASANAAGGTPVTYDWTFTGGTPPGPFTTSTATASSVYTTSGLKVVSVTVHYTDGRTATAGAQITLQPFPPGCL